MLKKFSSKNNKSVDYTDERMFLDTVELVIRLPCHMESTRYPFGSKKEWKMDNGHGLSACPLDADSQGSGWQSRDHER